MSYKKRLFLTICLFGIGLARSVGIADVLAEDLATPK